MHERTGTQQVPEHIRVEDIIPADLLSDGLIDRAHLEEVFRAPEKFLPPRQARQVRPEPEPEPATPAAEPPREPESRLARQSKLAGLLAAGLLLTGSIATAAVIRDRAPEHTSPASLEQDITGAAALGVLTLPSVPVESPVLPPSSPAGTSQEPSVTTPVTSAEPAGATPLSVPGTGTTANPGASGTGGQLSSVIDKSALVEKFYNLVDSNPRGALGMLTETLAGAQPGDLIRSWSSMVAVQVQSVREQADGAVLAVVTMVGADGRHTRVTQLLRFAEDGSGRISEARVLSAQATS